MRRMTRLGIVAALAAATTALVPTVVSATPDTWSPGTSVQPGHEENLGQTMPDKILSQDQSQGVSRDGRPQAYWVTAGNEVTPAMFQVTDLRTGDVVFAERLPRGRDSWANAFSYAEGAVYFATTEGYLYRWADGDEHVTQLDYPFRGEGIWRLAVAPDGTVYGGTYPGGLLWSYDPATGEFSDHGQIVPGETYGRALAVDDEHVYFGTQPNARLARMDRGTGEVTQMPLPAEYEGQSAVYDMTLAGRYLLARVQDVNDILVWDTTTLELVHVVEQVSGRAISPPDPSGQHVYFRRASQGIVQLTLGTWQEQPVRWGPNAFPGSWAWIDMADPRYPGLSLSMTYYRGRVYIMNLETRANAYYGEDRLQGAPTPLQALGVGDDGTVYTGGFLTPPGISAYRPDTGAFALLSGGGQVEGFGSFDGDVVYGRYPEGHLLRYDPDRPWTTSGNPGPATVIGHEQDRPQALVQAGELVVVGSVPKSGRLGGALSLWDPDTGAIEVHRDVVAQQSVVSLAVADGLVVGGTSIWGGYGIEPTAREAELFVFDLETRERRSTRVVVPGAESVNALTFDEKGKLWGIADGTLFRAELDPDTAEVRVERAEQLFGADRARYGADRGLVFRDGMLYATSGGRLWSVNPVTWRATALAGGGLGHLANGHDGSLYYVRGHELRRWVFEPTPEPPTCTTVLDEPHAAPVTVAEGTTCIVGTVVDGAITVQPGASLVIDGSRVTGPVRATGADVVWAFDADIVGPVALHDTARRVHVDSSRIDGPVTVRGSAGPVVVTATTVDGPLACDDNSEPPTDVGVRNAVAGPARGQCETW